MPPLNLFYAEPDFDRLLPFDRFPRRLIRRLRYGPPRPGGQKRVFLNLCAGLDRLQAPFRVNDFRHARKFPEELCCVLGKRHVLDTHPWPNPLMLGPCIHDHPVTDPDLLHRRHVRRILVPGEWMRRMCTPYWGDLVVAWPVGIDTVHWAPSPAPKAVDFILYNKMRWDQAAQEAGLVASIRAELLRRNLAFVEIKYGSYAPDEFRTLLASARAMIFLSEHETQGIAYQEALAAGVPILAFDRQGFWSDPEYYPHRVNYAPVSSVPYWDDRCGIRFSGVGEFPAALTAFQDRREGGGFDPRSYILDNLTLEKCAARFVEHAQAAISARPGSPA